MDLQILEGFEDFSGFAVVVVYAVHEEGLIFRADELEALEFGDGFVEGVFDAALVDEEAFEDAGFGEVVDGDAAAVGCTLAVHRVYATARMAVPRFGEDAVGVDVESAGTLEAPCQIDDAVGEHFFDVALRVEFFGDVGFEHVISDWVLVGQEGGVDPADWMMLREGEDTPRLAWQETFMGDIAGLYGVDMVDFARLASWWNEPVCDESNQWCQGADIDHADGADIKDLAAVAEDWLLK